MACNIQDFLAWLTQNWQVNYEVTRDDILVKVDRRYIQFPLILREYKKMALEYQHRILLTQQVFVISNNLSLTLFVRV